LRTAHIFVFSAAAFLAAASAFAGEGKHLDIHITTIPHAGQRYDTAGDWKFAADSDSASGVSMHIRVSQLTDEDFEFLVGLHEQLEAYLCRKRGIPEELVTAFDNLFEAERAAGKHGPDDEPGDSRRAPYGKEHRFATRIERLVATELGVDWSAYGKAIAALSQKEGK
jgi:hypothetical protein